MSNNITAPVADGTVFETEQQLDGSHRPRHSTPATDAILTEMLAKLGDAPKFTFNGPITLTGGTPVPYKGLVATRTGIANQALPGDFSLMGESYHIARDDIDAIQIAVSNFYVRIYEGLFTEEALGGDSTWMAAVHNLRTGEKTQMTWDGAPQAVLSHKGFGFTDEVALPSRIKRGERFAVRLWMHNPVAAPYYMTDNCEPGDIIEVSGSVSVEKTMGGDMADQLPLATLRPAAIIGTTTRPSVLLIGDSRMAGYGDTMDSTLDVGEVARSIGPYFGYTNFGVPGDRAEFFRKNGAVRLQMAQFCTHVIGNLAGNDIIQNRPAADIIADLKAIWALPGLAGHDVSWSTIGTYTPSADALPASEEVRRAVNAFIRSTPAPLARHFELAELDEPWRDAGNNIDAYFTDAIHNNRLGYLHKQSAQRIRPELFGL